MDGWMDARIAQGACGWTVSLWVDFRRWWSGFVELTDLGSITSVVKSLLHEI